MSLTLLTRFRITSQQIKRCITSSLPKGNGLANIEKNELVFQKSTEDLSSVTSYFPQTFNLAAYINSSETLKNLLHLNVNLSKIEKKPYVVEKILKLNFEENIKAHILFIQEYVELDSLGSFITKNPMILSESVDDLAVRINYLKSKHFSIDQIKQIIVKNPFWLMFSTRRIDRRLGHFQEQFSLSGNEVRMLATLQPKLITYNLHHVKVNSFVIKEEMGFEEIEVKQMLLKIPKLWMLNQKALLERFNYIHNTMKIPHKIILKYPQVLLSRAFRVKQRHIFLEKLGRAQYDPTKENYVPIIALVENTDIEFCKKYAKCNVVDFNVFLKTI